MSDCCSNNANNNTASKKQGCPVNGNICKEVSIKTILHHIKKPWAWEQKLQAYYFCDDPDCDVVYFAQDNSIIKASELRTKVGIKEKNKQSLLCYCFAVSYADATRHPEIKQFVSDKTRVGECACEVRNPSGKCCLQNFPN